LFGVVVCCLVVGLRFCTIVDDLLFLLQIGSVMPLHSPTLLQIAEKDSTPTLWFRVDYFSFVVAGLHGYDLLVLVIAGTDAGCSQAQPSRGIPGVSAGVPARSSAS
jgi:hypothetical protein